MLAINESTVQHVSYRANPTSVKELDLVPGLASKLLAAAFPGLALHRDERIVECTASFEELVGLETGAGRDRLITDFLPSESRAHSSDVSGDPTLYETVAIRADGSAVSLEVITVALESSQHGLSATAIRDVSGRRKFEKTLRQSQKLEALGRLAAGMAHEINNPLTYVMLQLDAIAEAFDRSDGELNEEEGRRIHDRVLEALEGAERVRKLTRALRDTARADETETDGAVDLAGVIDRAAKLSAAEIREHGTLHLDIPPLPAVLGNEGRLVQVLVNLLVNAAHALEGARDPRKIHVRAISTSAAVRLEITDTGLGIRRELLSRIFEPFFTTKPAGVGTGLGLSICRNIIQSSGGTISVESECGRGTRFTIMLLKAPAGTVPTTRLPATSPRPATARYRILVADDETSIREAISGLIGAEHDLVLAAGGKEAIEAIRLNPAFDVILCDLMMPDFGGIDLHRWLACDYPELVGHMIVMTGGETTPVARSFLEETSLPKLSKPFRAIALREAVTAVGNVARRVNA